MATKSPPHNLDIEASFLGSVLIDPDRLIEVDDLIKADDFFDARHQKIYQAINKLYQDNRKIDILTVVDQLKKNKVFSQVGGQNYLGELISVVPTARHIKDYAQVVAADARRRNLIGAGSEMQDLGYDQTQEVEQIIEQAEAKLFKISDRQVGPNVKDIESLLPAKFAQLEKLHNQPIKVSGLQTGFIDLDNKLAGLQKSDLLIVAARPAMGKTSLALNIALNVAKKKNQVLFFSLEMSQDQLLDRLLSIESGIKAWQLRTGPLKDSHFSKINRAMGVLNDLNLFIDDSIGLNVGQLRTKARRESHRHGLDLIVVDYLQLMSGMRPSYNESNRVHEVTEISRSLKHLARELNIPVIVLSQLNRSVESREGNQPKLADLRDSGSIEQDADIVLFLYRDDYYNPESKRPNTVDILIKKHRNGPTGQVELYFDTDRQRYVNKEPSQKATKMS